MLRQRPQRPEQAQGPGRDRAASASSTSARSRSADYKLDITWLKDDSLEDANDLPEPQDLAAEAITELEAVVDDLRDILQLIETNGNNQNG